MLVSLNGLRRDETLRPGTVLLVPVPSADDPSDPFTDAAATGKPVVVVPALAFSYPDRKRVFYRVVLGDTLRDVAGLFGATPDEVCRWNAIDAGAMLHDGMVLQIYASSSAPRREDVLALEEKDAHVLAVGSPEFFTHFEGLKGRTRLELVAKQGDTWRSIGQKYGLTSGQLERINGRGRSTPLAPGDKIIVYVASTKVPATPAAKVAKDTPDDKSPDVVAVTKSSEHAAPSPEERDAATRDDGVQPAGLPIPVPKTR
jgi:membrane-bound lytic murein transglycosylase D